MSLFEVALLVGWMGRLWWMELGNDRVVLLYPSRRRLIKVIVVFAADLGQKGGERNEALFAI